MCCRQRFSYCLGISSIVSEDSWISRDARSPAWSTTIKISLLSQPLGMSTRTMPEATHVVPKQMSEMSQRIRTQPGRLMSGPLETVSDEEKDERNAEVL